MQRGRCFAIVIPRGFLAPIVQYNHRLEIRVRVVVPPAQHRRQWRGRHGPGGSRKQREAGRRCGNQGYAGARCHHGKAACISAVSARLGSVQHALPPSFRRNPQPKPQRARQVRLVHIPRRVRDIGQRRHGFAQQRGGPFKPAPA